MALFTNRVHDAIAAAFVRWNTASPDTTGVSYPGPDAFGNTTDFVVEAVAATGGVTDHGALLGLSDDDHTQYALLAGRAGGQSLVGGTGGSDTLTLRSTTDGAPGDHNIEVNDNLDLNTFDILAVGDYGGATGTVTGLWTFTDGLVATKTTAGSAIAATAAEGDEVAVLGLTSVTTVSGSNPGVSGIHVGSRTPETNVDAAEGTVYVRTGVGTASIYIKDSLAGTLTGWVDLRTSGSSAAAGSPTELQFNTGGVLDADSGLVWTGSILDVVGTSRASVQQNVLGTGTGAAFSGTTGSGEANAVIQLDTTNGAALNGSTTNVHVGTADPNGSLSATAGSIYIRADGVTPANSTMYVNIDGATAWSDMRVAGGGGDFRNDFITGEIVTGTDSVLSGVLSDPASDAQSILIMYNRQALSQGQDFTVSGTAITWLASSGTAPDLIASDTLFIYYVVDSTLPTIDFRNDFITGESVTGADSVLSGALTDASSDDESIICAYNRQVLSQGQDFTVSGTAITWLASSGTAPDLIASDTLQFYYVVNTTGGGGGGGGSSFSWVATKSGAYTASAFEIVPLNPSGGGFTIMLPASPTKDDIIYLVNITTSTNTVTIDGNSNNINLAASYPMSSSQEEIQVSYTGTEWFIIG